MQFFNRDPRYQYMEQESKRHAQEEGVEHWQWDEVPVAGFIAADRVNDGGEFDLRYGYWLAMRMKFMDKRFVDFFKDYLTTHERHYDTCLDGSICLFTTMRVDSLSYIETILVNNYSFQRSYPCMYKPEWNYGVLGIRCGF